MTTITNEIRLVIHLEGGFIHAVYSNSDIPIKVAIQDLDIEGADGDEIAELADGTEFVGSIQPTTSYPVHVASVFMALGEEIPVLDKKQEDYFTKHSLICPNCGSGNIESTGSVEIDGPFGFCDVECNNCKATWTDQYGIVGLRDLVVKHNILLTN